MSQSPSDPTANEDERAGFLAANRHLNRMLQQGVSFSGHERNCAFLNTGEARFANISAVAGFDFLDDGRALALVDWDHDGDLDVWVANRTAPGVRFLRNDTPTDAHFLALKLEGRTANRDAIGARVEVVLGGQKSQETTGHSPPATRHLPLIRTLRAGEGFIGQSSKWIHFGLGDSTDLDRVIVHWPGGQAEVFHELEVDRLYHVVEGSGNAQVWTPPARELQLDPSTPQMPEPTEQAAIVLTSRVLLPPLEYQSFDGDSVFLDQQVDGPALINLWASWCRPCWIELQEFARHEQQLRDAGIDILALSVEGADDTGEAGAQSAKKMIDEINFPFLSGIASKSAVEKLQLLHDELFLRQLPLPAPSSFLIDQYGRVAAIYKGPVSVERLLEDVANLQLEGSQRWQAALPFEGRMHWEPPAENSFGYFQELIAKGYLDEVTSYLARRETKLKDLPSYRDLLAMLGTELGKQNALSSSIDMLSRAVKLSPDDAAIRKNLAAGLVRTNQLEQAVAEFREVLRLSPADAMAQLSLGTTLARQARYGEAAELIQRAIDLDPQLAVEGHRNLGLIFEKQARLPEAAAQYRRVVELEPGSVAHRQKLVAVLAQLDDINPRDPYVQLLLRSRPDDPGAHHDVARWLSSQGKLAEAIALNERAVELDPKFAAAYKGLGDVCLKQGLSAEAIQHYRRALSLDENLVLAANNLAWLLATSAEPSLRDGQEAVRWAEHCQRLTGAEHPALVSGLAAAYAEAGRFEDAVKTAQRGLQLARSQGDEQLTQRFEKQLQLYENGQPYRE